MVFSKPQKIAVIIFIAFALGIIFLNPFKVGKPKLNKFTVTPNPQDTFNKAYDSKNPIFLEFYAPW